MQINISSISKPPNKLHHVYIYEILMDNQRNHFGSITIDIINNIAIASINWCTIETDSYYDKSLNKNPIVLNYEIDVSYYIIERGCTCQEILDGYTSFKLNQFSEDLYTYLNNN